MKLMRTLLPLCFLLTSPVFAQGETSSTLNNIDAAATEKSAEEKALGWAWNAGLTLGGNVLQNKNTVSQVEGQTNIYSGKFELAVDHIGEDTEWENRLSIEEILSRTPSIDRVIKTGDVIDLSSIYKQFLPSLSWLGGYGSFEASSTVFATFDEQADDVTYAIAEADGDTRTETDNRFRLAKSFSPITLKESIGLVAKLTDNKAYKTEFKTGPGAKQIMLKDQYFLLSGDEFDETPEIEVAQYNDDIRIFGWVGILSIQGNVLEEKLTYKLFAEFLTPISYHPENEDDPDKIKLTATEAGANIAYKFSDWLALAYEFKSKRDPILQPESQVTHSTLLTATLKTGG